MKKSITVAFILFLMAGFMFSPIFAADGKTLFNTLTCVTCHGQDGKGMFRTKTKEEYRLKSKVLKKLKKEGGIPDTIIAKLKTITKKKYKTEKKFLKALNKTIGEKATNQYQDTIFKYAYDFKYKKGDPIGAFVNYPKLAGNKEIYLFMQMKDILEGRRINGNTAAMRGIKPFLQTNKIGDKELLDIARYLSQVP
jgi:cytochrome c553